VELEMNTALPIFVAYLALPFAVLSAETPDPVAVDRAAVVDGNNAFAFALYGKLRSQSGNLIFSPESISAALAMTYAGAHGNTASEMAKALHFTLPPDRLHPAMGELLRDINTPHDGYQLRVADALWAQKGDTLLPDFLNLVKTNYGAAINQVDFKSATEAARMTINEWVAQSTDDKITDLLVPGVLTPKSRLVLTNGAYFKGTWEPEFDKAQTKEEDFHLPSAKTLKALLMHRVGHFKYFNGGTFQALELPYKSGEVSMIVFLPSDVSGLSSLEQSLTASSAQLWIQKLESVPKVIVTMPRFKVTQQFGLSETLGEMGMPQAFEKGVADFSGMTGNRDFVMSAVIHKAYIDVNEEGTEAAAATAVVMSRAMAVAPNRMQPPIFRADHPFIFLIRDNRSRGILFMGRVVNPTNMK
jgi:serpin B